MVKGFNVIRYTYEVFSLFIALSSIVFATHLQYKFCLMPNGKGLHRMFMPVFRSSLFQNLVWTGSGFFFVAYLYLALTDGWLGPLMSDDFSYLGAGLKIIQPETFIPMDHWEVRHTLTVPLALIINLFGLGEVPLVLTSSIYFVATASVIGFWVARTQNLYAGLLVPIVIVLTPISVQQFSTLNVDIIEAFFWFSSVFLFLQAPKVDRRLLALYLAGMCAGLAMMSRETSAGLLLGYAILFLFGQHIARRYFWMMAAGFVTIIALEMIYYVWAIGNPFHRYDVLFSSFGVGSHETTGNFITNPIIGPVMALFINNEFGMLFPLAVLSMVYLVRHRQLRWSSDLGLLVVIGLIQFVVSAYFLGLRPLPRYFTIQAFIAGVPSVLVALDLMRKSMYRRHVALGFLFVTMTHFSLLDLSNNSARLAEKVYASYIQPFSAVRVFSDPITCARGKMLLTLNERAAYIEGEPCERPQIGGLLIISDLNLTAGALWGVPFDASVYRDIAAGLPFEVVRGRKTYIGIVLTMMGAPEGGVIPTRFYYDAPSVTVYWIAR